MSFHHRKIAAGILICGVLVCLLGVAFYNSYQDYLYQEPEKKIPASISDEPAPTVDPSDMLTDYMRATLYPTSSATESGLLTVNWHDWAYSRSSIDTGLLPLSFQIKFPDRYVATSSDMLIPFDSTGGIYLIPNITLTQDKQAFGLLEKDGNFARNVLDLGKDCILIFINGQTASLEESRQLNGWASTTARQISTTTSSTNGFTVQWGTVFDDETGREITDAQIELPKRGSYYFLTCTKKSIQDLQTVLEHFRVAPLQ